MTSSASSYLVSVLTDQGHVEQSEITAEQYDLPVEADTLTGHIRLERTGPDALRIENLSDIGIDVDEVLLPPRGATEAKMPLTMRWRRHKVTAAMSLDDSQLIQGCTPVSGLTNIDQTSRTPTGSFNDPLSTHPAPSSETLASWFGALGAIQRQAACTQEFYSEAVRSIVDPGGLDAGFLLEPKGNGWEIVRSHSSDDSATTFFQPRLAAMVARRREPLVFHASELGGQLVVGDPGACFAAPIFDEGMNVAFVLYGARQSSNTNRRHHIRQLESLWIHLLAEAVTAGVVRKKHETDLACQRVLLERVFPTDIVRQLCLQPKVEFPAEEKEVTIMFVDLIDSTSLCESQPPDLICRFLAEVMDTMTEVILEHGGVIVDYYGDGLIAMWNAPVSQPHHAKMACESGLALQRRLAHTNSTWAYRLGRINKFGIGIHTGNAIVGNSGSRHRLKYGPRGFSVTLANRIEKATRKLNQPLLISSSTREQLPIDASAYRLGKFRLAGVDEPTVLYALVSLDPNETANSCCATKHVQVMKLVRDGNFSGAADHLDGCQGCAMDELSLEFLASALRANSTEGVSSDLNTATPKLISYLP